MRLVYLVWLGPLFLNEDWWFKEIRGFALRLRISYSRSELKVKSLEWMLERTNQTLPLTPPTASGTGGWALAAAFLSGQYCRPIGASSPNLSPFSILVLAGCWGLGPSPHLQITLKVHSSSKGPCGIRWNICCNCIIVYFLPLLGLASLPLYRCWSLEHSLKKILLTKLHLKSFPGTRLDTVS